MKTIQKIFIIVTTILLVSLQLTAQESRIDFESLKIGKVYKIQIENGWETEGKLIKIDSTSIQMKSEFKIFIIKKSEITEINGFSPGYENNITNPEETDYKALKKKDFFISGASGISFPGGVNSDYYLPGLNFQLNVTKSLSSSKAIRGAFEFSQSPGKDRVDSYALESGNYYTKTEAGNLNSYSLKFDLLFGSFKESSKLNPYFILGSGLNIVREGRSKYTYTYPEYNYKTQMYSQRTYSSSYNGSSWNQVSAELGGGLGYKISDKVKLFSEVQYGIPVIYFSEYGGYIFVNLMSGNPSLKFGVQVEL